MGQSSSSSTTVTSSDPAPTRNPENSIYFSSHNNNPPHSAARNEPLDLHTLLQSYAHLYVPYLQAARNYFSQNILSSNSTLTFSPLATSFSDPSKSASIILNDKKTVAVQFKLSQGAVNKIVNEVAKSGRFHDDHNIIVKVLNVKIPENMRTQLYDDACNELAKKEGATAFRSMEKSGFPTTFGNLTVVWNQYQRGLGFVGTATTNVVLNDEHGDVEFAALK